MTEISGCLIMLSDQEATRGYALVGVQASVGSMSSLLDPNSYFTYSAPPHDAFTYEWKHGGTPNVKWKTPSAITVPAGTTAVTMQWRRPGIVDTWSSDDLLTTLDLHPDVPAGAWSLDKDEFATPFLYADMDTPSHGTFAAGIVWDDITFRFAITVGGEVSYSLEYPIIMYYYGEGA